MNNSSQTIPETGRRYEVSQSDLPLCCPMPGKDSWDSHPRVYLDIESKGEVLCPYCGATYVLKQK